MSNGGTSVFINALALSGSHLALDDFEIELISWIVARDQNVSGIGTVGFDLQEMPWSQDEDIFQQQKDFVLKIIQRAKTEQDLQALSYNAEFLHNFLERFESMINSFLLENVNAEDSPLSIPTENNHLKCDVHGVFLHEQGCVICNDK